MEQRNDVPVHIRCSALPYRDRSKGTAGTRERDIRPLVRKQAHRQHDDVWKHVVYTITPFDYVSMFGRIQIGAGHPDREATHASSCSIRFLNSAIFARMARISCAMSAFASFMPGRDAGAPQVHSKS